MSYNKAQEIERIMNIEGVADILKTYDRAKELDKVAGCFLYGNLLLTGDSWRSMACIDALEEAGYLKIERDPGDSTQNFVVRLIKK